MSRLTDLIAKAKAKDAQLGADLENEFRALSSRLSFGLNFERHRPEAVELPGRAVRRGDKVRVLPPRGSTTKGDQRLWVVKSINKSEKAAEIELLDSAEPEMLIVELEDLVVIAEFRDKVYPGLISTGSVERGGDKPFHTVINGENYHVLRALTWTHRGKIDAIYIDPPYNTGAKDWKYNNDYVEGEDLYRHSKWLAMMERRLHLAKELLNPSESVLIVTIDEKEYLRLGLLLEQVFPEAVIQMVSTAISPTGSARAQGFRRCDEYLFIVIFGSCSPVALDLSDEWRVGRKTSTATIRWSGLMRSGTEARRQDRSGMFYPIFVKIDSGQISSIGAPISLDDSRQSVIAPQGTVSAWPIRKDGSEGRWQISDKSARKLLASGYLRAGKIRGEQTAISYLKAGEQRKVQQGIFGDFHLNELGYIEVESGSSQHAFIPTTQWNLLAHSASEYGSTLLRSMLTDRQFPFPKSLYAVEDVLRFFVHEKLEAVVLDFFSGSGTTAHAVMRLNRQDAGRRQCICVTNNEVGADEQKSLRQQGLRPGDDDWEKWGICDYITKPRVAAAITGKTQTGEPIKGEYKFTDEFPMAEGFGENARFFSLTYETPVAVAYQTSFLRIAPLLWLRAGSVGRCIDSLPTQGYEVVESYGLLVELDKAAAFVGAIRTSNQLKVAYIVTDDERRFQAISRRMPDGVQAIRLYENYLSNFAFLNGDNK